MLLCVHLAGVCHRDQRALCRCQDVLVVLVKLLKARIDMGVFPSKSGLNPTTKTRIGHPHINKQRGLLIRGQHYSSRMNSIHGTFDVRFASLKFRYEHASI